MLRDEDEIDPHVAVDVQLLNIRRRFLTYGCRRIDPLSLIHNNQITCFRVHMPLTQPLLVYFDVLDGQVTNAINKDATPLGELSQQPHCMQSLATSRHTGNQSNHFPNTILVADVSR
ncbi:hypothetical protein WS83_19415 [Burkholderia sp. MSMB2042]|nr:hypothetical protein WS83_19415 [Burkholderia sp. MSMB2042]